MGEVGEVHIISYPWLAGNEGVEKQMETTIMGYIGTTRRVDP